MLKKNHHFNDLSAFITYLKTEARNKSHPGLQISFNTKLRMNGTLFSTFFKPHKNMKMTMIFFPLSPKINTKNAKLRRNRSVVVDVETDEQNTYGPHTPVASSPPTTATPTSSSKKRTSFLLVVYKTDKKLYGNTLLNT